MKTGTEATAECLWEALRVYVYHPSEYMPWRWQDRVGALGEDEVTARHRALRADSPIVAGLRKMTCGK